MREKLTRFMQGRYGIDSFSKFLLYAGLILLLITSFIRILPIMYLGLVIVIYSYYRIFSRNYSARQRENNKYLNCIAKVKGFFSGSSRTKTRDSGVRIFQCPSCGQKVRVPSGKGKIQITCPKCHVKFIKKT